MAERKRTQIEIDAAAADKLGISYGEYKARQQAKIAELKRRAYYDYLQQRECRNIAGAERTDHAAAE